MKNLFICFALLLSVHNVNAQTEPHEICGYKTEVERIIKRQPNYLQWQEAWFQEALSQYKELQNSKRQIIADTLYFEIPVVFHIIYNNSTENINDSLIHNQIRELNYAYRKLTTDTSRIRSIFKPIAADVRIQFKLATIDENGNATTGITRTSTTKTTFATNQFGAYSLDMKYSTFGKRAWDPTKYLNFWVCDMEYPNPIGIVYGFATPPTGSPNWNNTGLTKDTNDYESGVVLHYKVVGRMSPLSPTKYVEGKTAVHEVGHYLGLRHVWGDGNSASGCSVDDGIEDTPNARVSNSTCGGQNTCVDATNDKPDQTENYMDYALDGCAAMFTKQQAAMMRFVLNNLRPSLPKRVVEYDTILPPPNVDFNVSVYPNPSYGDKDITIRIAENMQQNYTVDVVDMCGKQVLSVKMTSNKDIKLDTVALAKAVYYITIRNSSNEVVHKQAVILQ